MHITHSSSGRGRPARLSCLATLGCSAAFCGGRPAAAVANSRARQPPQGCVQGFQSLLV